MPDQTLSPTEAADVAELRNVEDIEQRASFLAEIGSTGLKRSSGYVDEEFLPHLRGRKAVQVYREMGDNDAISGGMLFAINQLVKGVAWPVEPAGKSKDDAAAAKLLETCLDDMSSTWSDTLSEILTSLQYGWSWHEIVFKRRMGPWQKDGRHRSKYNDGLVGIRKMPIRAQETLHRWIFDESGDVKAMVQLAPPTYDTRTIPLSRSVLFRNGVHKGNPEGRSLLRTSYRSWYYKKRLEEFESVGVERDLAGLPMVTVPASYLKAAVGSDEHKMVVSMQRMVRAIRRNEQEGLVFPAAYDPETKQPLFKFELLGSGGARQFSTNELITRYEQRQLMSILADWIMVGHTNTGTYNMHVDKTGVFRQALNSVVNSIADTLNTYMVPMLFAQNGWKPEKLPKLVPSSVDVPDLAQLGQFLTQTTGLGYTWGPDVTMERFLRRAAGLPDLTDEEQGKHRQFARREEAARFAEEEVRYLAARSQLAQALAAEQAAASGELTPEEATQAQQMAAGTQQQEATMAEQERAAESHEKEMATPIPKPAASGAKK